MCVSMRIVKGYLVPCGVCYDCLSIKRNSWAVRNKIEYSISKKCYFVTLTYDDDHISDLSNFPYSDIRLPNFSHFQNFMKRLRSRLSCGVRYFCCHEYGARTYRPHYHVLLYLDSDVPLWTRDIQILWPHGFITSERANDARIHYMTKYLTKSVRYQSDWKTVISDIYVRYSSYIPRCVVYGSDDIVLSDSPVRVKDFLTWYADNPFPMDIDYFVLRDAIVYYNTFLRMSLKPAIGASKLNDTDWVSWLRDRVQQDGSYPSLSLYGCSYPLPRYYIHKIFSPLERILVADGYESKIMQDIEDDADRYSMSIAEYMDNKMYLSNRKLKFIESLQISKELRTFDNEKKK